MRYPGEARIMIVDDDPVAGELTSIILKKLGYQVTGIAMGAEAALAELSRSKPDLVLTDIELPGYRVLN